MRLRLLVRNDGRVGKRMQEQDIHRQRYRCMSARPINSQRHSFFAKLITT
jgi:hypothetical protein